MRTKYYIFFFCLICGLLFRLYSCFFTGHIGDMSQYMDWGEKTLNLGLANSFKGIYYPLQYQLFELCSFISTTYGFSDFVVYKLFNLPFDIGILFLLIKLLDELKFSRLYALLYWVNPWFLNNFLLGFIDTQYTFLLLLTIYLFKENGKIKDYIISGIPLGLAFVLKPQVVMVIFTLFLIVFFYYMKEKKYKFLGVFLSAVVFFVLYEIYFTVLLYPSVYIESKAIDIPSIFLLPAHYINVKNISPCCLTASMMNFWYPIADILRQPDSPIYSVSSKTEILPFVSMGSLVLLIAVIILVKYSYSSVKKTGFILSKKVLINTISFVSLFVPFFMTNAHYNHPYLGSVLLILIIPLMKNKLVKISALLLYVLFFVNIAFFAGFGGMFDHYSLSSKYIFGISLVFIIPFVLVLYYLYKGEYFKEKEIFTN